MPAQKNPISKIPKLSRAPLLVAILILFAANLRVPAQGTFTNLDFESAFPTIRPTSSPGSYPTTTLLPGWSVFYGANPISQIYFDDVSLGSTQATLIGPNDPFGPNAMDGNFSINLYGGSTFSDVSIRQSSLVPILTQSILFKAQAEGPMSLSLGSQDIPFVALSTGPNYTLYGGNIPASLAGQFEQLEFSVPEGFGVDNSWTLDSIVFSPNPIPEPGAWSLLLCGVGLLGAIRYARSKSNR